MKQVTAEANDEAQLRLGLAPPAAEGDALE